MTAILLRKTAKLHANNADVVQKVNKKKRRTWGSAPHPATFEKVDETFKLPEPQSVRGGEPFTRNRLAALPEKDSLL